MTHVLIVEDDIETASALRALIDTGQFTVALAQSLREAQGQVVLQRPDIILLDLQLPDGSGMDLFAQQSVPAETEVVLITGNASIETSIQALRMGAADYLVKPIVPRQLHSLLARLTRVSPPRMEVSDFEVQLAKHGRFGRLWGRSPVMRQVYQQISCVAETGVTVFVTGESGTGKELVAQSVHELSLRRNEPFLALNCGAISPQLIESEIFGHEKGSFTGAERRHLGFFERASGGTLFLDEVTEMPHDFQVKLLRVLETGRFMRVGSSQALATDVRIIAASNRLPTEAVATGRLREDLYYRLNVFPIELPPLRDRQIDVPVLAQHFLDLMGSEQQRAKRFSADALARLSSYRWPGNVRELRNAVQRAYVMAAGDEIDERWLPDPRAPAPVAARWAGRDSGFGSSGFVSSGFVSSGFGPSGFGPVGPGPGPSHGSAREASVAVNGDSLTLRAGCSLAAAERSLIVLTLRHYEHHKERTAAALGISLKTLYNRLKEYEEAAQAGEH